MTQDRISPVPREARAYQGAPAGLVTRMLANTVDTVVVVMVLLAGWAGYNGLRFMLDPRGFSFGGASALLSLFAGFVVVVVYLTAAWAMTGRTYGDHVMGLRVVGRRGRKLRPVLAFLRACFCAVFPIGLFWCVLSRKRRSVQDTVLRTSVVYDWLPRSATFNRVSDPSPPTASPPQPPVPPG